MAEDAAGSSLTAAVVQERLARARAAAQAACARAGSHPGVEARLRAAEALLARAQLDPAAQLADEVLVLARGLREHGVPQTALELATARLNKARAELDKVLQKTRAETVQEFVKAEQALAAAREEATQARTALEERVGRHLAALEDRLVGRLEVLGERLQAESAAVREEHAERLDALEQGARERAERLDALEQGARELAREVEAATAAREALARDLRKEAAEAHEDLAAAATRDVGAARKEFEAALEGVRRAATARLDAVEGATGAAREDLAAARQALEGALAELEERAAGERAALRQALDELAAEARAAREAAAARLEALEEELRSVRTAARGGASAEAEAAGAAGLEGLLASPELKTLVEAEVVRAAKRIERDILPRAIRRALDEQGTTD
ncbi:MAG: hypothetical protein D6731_00485 [Planctomycetota bacterium]|nr:MAG: hypothetical protein D6731_00485 [Planctomycetota bacterium]